MPAGCLGAPGDAGVGVALGVLLHEEHLREHLRARWWPLPQLFGLALICAGVLAPARAPLPEQAGRERA